MIYTIYLRIELRMKSIIAINILLKLFVMIYHKITIKKVDTIESESCSKYNYLTNK